MKKISVLMIGNSFAVDIGHYTHNISLGSDVEIELGVLYVGGCSLEMHCEYIDNNSKMYEWFVNGVSTGRYISLEDALLMKKWDYITLQQVSYLSGKKDSFYPYLDKVIDYVRKYQKDSKLMLHKTWPYESTFTNDTFSGYNYDRTIMYNSICETFEYISKKANISSVIRSGDIVEKAIQNYGEHFHRDGFHLNDDGRYLTALGFVHMFSGLNPINDLFVPEVNGFDFDKCKDYDNFVIKVLKNEI